MYDLSLLIVRTEDSAVGAPLIVELRNTELTRRLGFGQVAGIATSPNRPVWKSVDWVEAPMLEPGEDYTIVIFSGDRDSSWALAVGSAGLYPFGDLSVAGGRGRHDIGFRMTFESGERLDSEFAATTEPIEDFLRYEDRESEYGLKWHPYKQRMTRRDPWPNHLPQCSGSRCADFYDALKGTPDERQEAAAASFEVCRETPRTIARMKTPVVGLSCRDVCTGLDFGGCEGLIADNDVCSGELKHLSSCDRIVSAHGPPNKVGCLCSQEEIDHHRPLEDPQKIQEVIRESYGFTRDDEPRLRKHAAPYGVTCRQVCEEFGIPECRYSRCDELVLPWRANCPPCGENDRRSRRRRDELVVVEDRIVATRHGRYFVIEPKTARVREVEGLLYLSRRPKTAGRFAVWNTRWNDERRLRILDTRSAKVREVTDSSRGSSRCEYHAEGAQLVEICPDGDQFQIWSIFEGEERIHTPTIKRARTVVSWDGATLVVRGRGGDLFAWTRGDSDWELREGPPIEPGSLRLDWASARLLDALYEAKPDAPQFIDGVYYRFGRKGLWAYEPKSDEFTRWPAHIRGGVVEEELIRAHQYVFDRDSRVLKRIDIGAEAWAGAYAITRGCPKMPRSTPLAEPFDDLCMVHVDPATVPAIEVIEGETVEVEGP